MARLAFFLALIGLGGAIFPPAARSTDPEEIAVYDIIGSDEPGGRNPKKIGIVAMQPSSGRYAYRWTIDREVHSKVNLPQGALFAIAAYDGVRWWSGGYGTRDPSRLVVLDAYDVPPVSLSNHRGDTVKRDRTGPELDLRGLSSSELGIARPHRSPRRWPCDRPVCSLIGCQHRWRSEPVPKDPPCRSELLSSGFGRSSGLSSR